MSMIRFEGRTPAVAPEAFVAPSVTLIGQVRLADRSSVWYGCVLRADGDVIQIGEGSNLQDGVVAHADPGLPLTVGRGVSVGHRAVLHGCSVGDDSLIGMGAIVLNGAKVGSSCLVAAGTVVLEGSEIPDGSLVAGIPGKVRRSLSEAEKARLVANAEVYLDLAARHRRATA